MASLQATTINGNATVTGTISASNFSGTSTGTNTGDQTNISGNAATATNVAWSGITSKPTTLSGFGITDAMYQYDPNGFVQGDINGSGNMQRLWGPDSVQNLLAFRPPTTIEYTTDNVNWTATTINNSVFDNKLFGKWSGFNIGAGANVGNWTKVRLTWVDFGYHFFSHFNLAHSTNGHSMNFVFYKSDLNGVFTSEAFRVNGINSWPGYTFAAHNNVSGWWDTKDVRIIFEVVRNNDYPNNYITVGSIQLMGGYSSFIRLYDWDGNRNITMAGTVTAAGFTGPGTGLTGTAASLSIGGNAATASSVAATNITGTVAINSGGTGAATTTANAFFVGPNGSAGAPSFRAMATSDIPASIVTFAKLQDVAGPALVGRLSATSGSVAALGSANARTAIGATTVGSNLITLADTSTTKKYIEINTDNTVTLLEAAAFRNAIGAGTGNGTVTNVTGTGAIASSEGATPVISLNDAGVTYAKIQNVSASRVLGRITASAGVVEELTGANIAQIIGANTITNATNATNATNVTGTVAVANGGTGGTTQATGRSGLGATTVGSNFFTLANPGAETYVRINAANTISLLSAADFKTALGIGTSSGTVTSITAGDGLSGGTINSTGTIAVDTTVVRTSGNQTIGGTKTFSSAISGSINGNAATVSDGVYLSTNQTITGTKTFSNAIVAPNAAKAWVHFNGTGTVAINANYNVSSITDNGVGDYTVNFTSAFVDANYVVAGTATYDYTLGSSLYGSSLNVPRQTNAQVAGSCRLAAEYLHGAQLYDAVAVRAVFYR